MMPWLTMFMSGGGVQTIVAGTPVVIESVSADSRVAGVSIDGANVFVTYSTTTATRGMVVTVSGNTVTANTAISYRAAQSSFMSAGLISSTQVVVGYDNFAQVLSVSGTTLTTNTALTVTNASGGMAVGVLGTTSVFALYQNSSTTNRARVLTVSGSVALVENAETTLNSSVTGNQNKVVPISSGAVLCGYNDNSLLELQIASVSGTSVTANSATSITVTFTGQEAYGLALNNSSKAFVTYRNSLGTSLEGRNVTLGSTSITAISSAATVASGALGFSYYEGLAAANTDQCVSIYSNPNLSDAGYGVVIDNPSSITANSATQFESGAMRSNTLIKLSDTKFLAFYIDGGNSNRPTACVLEAI